MFRVKICGVTRPADASLIGRLCVDAVGLNFWPGSPRHVSVETARAIVGQLPLGMLRVGVFVNADEELLRQVVQQVPLDVAQLHGDEPPEMLARLTDLVVVRALRIGPTGAAGVCEYVRQVTHLGGRLAGIILDAATGSAYGGTGQVADWSAAAQLAGLPDWPPVILAGGLGPHNVAAAVAHVRPYGVDAASGVESAPGVKDPALVEQFVVAARLALGLRS